MFSLLFGRRREGGQVSVHKMAGTFSHVFKKNPYHDERGRFTSKENAGAGGDSHTAGESHDRSGNISLTDHYKKYDDPNVTPETILRQFTPQERAEIAMAMMKAKAVPTSKQLYTDRKGVYTPERQKLHEKIISEYLSPENLLRAMPQEGKSPTFVVLGGRGGSGKSAFTGEDGGVLGYKKGGTRVKEFDASKFLVLDTDDIKKRLKPPYKGWNAYSVHDESAHVFDIITEAAVSLGLNIVHDTTLRSKSIESTITTMKSNGYKVQGHYMFVPRQVSATRAVQRYLGDGPKARGRLVPVEVILDNTRNEQNFEDLKKHFDRWSAYDNQGSAPELLGRGKKAR